MTRIRDGVTGNKMKPEIENRFDMIDAKLDRISLALISPQDAKLPQAAEVCRESESVCVRIPNLADLALARGLLEQSGIHVSILAYRCIATSEAGVALVRRSGITTESADFLDDKQKRAEVAAQDLGPDWADWVRSVQLPQRRA